MTNFSNLVARSKGYVQVCDQKVYCEIVSTACGTNAVLYSKYLIAGNNLRIEQTTSGSCRAVLYCGKCGLDWSKIMDAINAANLFLWSFTMKEFMNDFDKEIDDIAWYVALCTITREQADYWYNDLLPENFDEMVKERVDEYEYAMLCGRLTEGWL